MHFVKRQLVWMAVVLLTLTACEPVEDLGDAIGDLIKSLPLP